MAKKSTKKSNNSMNLLWDLLTMLLGGLLLGLMALPYEKLYVLGVETGSATGYQLISFEEGANIGISVVMLLLTIFAGLMVLGAFLKMLSDLNVVKNKTFEKVAKFVMIISALATLVLTIVSLIMVANVCDGKADGITGKVSGLVAVWMSLIINACVGAVAFVASLFAVKK